MWNIYIYYNGHIPSIITSKGTDLTPALSLITMPEMRFYSQALK